jgi:asparagine synthase (glutamine-hydrolysing)
MCGIAGIFAFNDIESTAAGVGRMERSLVHRGPDDGGTKLIVADQAHLGLACRRLAIQDLSLDGHQPMGDSATGNWIVFNGEIYNFLELRHELEQLGQHFDSHSDTEVILKAYSVWGIDTLTRLRGMFAFCIWDSGQRRLFLARDRLGVKPLYYAELPRRLVFGSEVRTILASGFIHPHLNRSACDGFLQLGAVQEPETLIEGVSALPAGHYGVYANGRLEISEYWSLRDSFDASTSVSREPWAQIRNLLEESVRLRMISDAPIGVFLSGGLDSAAVAALAAQHSTRPLKTVSIVFDEERYSEKPYIDATVRRYGCSHSELRLSPESLLEALPEALASMDQPTFDGINTYIVSREARSAGLTVALSGIGGDELFGGYPSFHRTATAKRIRTTVPAPVRRAAAFGLRLAYRDSDSARKAARWISSVDGDPSQPEQIARELFTPSDRAWLLPNNGVTRAQREHGRPLADNFNSVSFLELNHYLRNVLLRDTDGLSMAHGLEVREPFLDHKLLEHVAGLPGSIKNSKPGYKPLLQAAVKGDVPEEVLQHPKMGFTLPFAEWLKGPLHREVQDVLLDQTIGGEAADVLDATAVSHVWRRFDEGRANWVRPWALYVLKRWCDMWLASQTAEPSQARQSVDYRRTGEASSV